MCKHNYLLRNNLSVILDNLSVYLSRLNDLSRVAKEIVLVVVIESFIV